MTGIGIMGCGAMGTELAVAVSSGKVGDAVLVALFDSVCEQALSVVQELSSPIPIFDSSDAFLASPGLDMVVECASPDAVRAYGEAILSKSKDLIIMSTGALTDTRLFKHLAFLAETLGLRLMVPSGAIGGIDAIRAVRDQLHEITLTTTKAPQALRGSPGFKAWESIDFTDARVVFEGPAVEAVALFPANVNVSATLSLAGLGPEKTIVRVVADPCVTGNIHDVLAKGDFGVMQFTLENRPHPRNSRTSHLAILSALETLRTACTTEPRIGT